LGWSAWQSWQKPKPQGKRWKVGCHGKRLGREAPPPPPGDRRLRAL
jgi:hypothetical protein